MAAAELGHGLRTGPSPVWQELDDRWLNIETGGDPSAPTDALERHGEALEQHGEAPAQQSADEHRSRDPGANYLYLEQIARLVTREAQEPLVFYDLGCGKGRPLCVMARHPFAKVVGIDVDPELCEIARRNARRLRGRVAPIEIVRADAASLDYSDGHVFFFFDSFWPPTLRAVLDSIERSLVRAPRRVTVIYYNAVHEAVLGTRPWLACYGLLPTFSGLRVSFWRNRRLVAPRSPST